MDKRSRAGQWGPRYKVTAPRGSHVIHVVLLNDVYDRLDFLSKYTDIPKSIFCRFWIDAGLDDEERNLTLFRANRHHLHKEWFGKGSTKASGVCVSTRLFQRLKEWSEITDMSRCRLVREWVTQGLEYEEQHHPVEKHVKSFYWGSRDWEVRAS